MGYRSQVVLAISKQLRPAFMAALAPNKEATALVFNHHDTLDLDNILRIVRRRERVVREHPVSAQEQGETRQQHQNRMLSLYPREYSKALL